MSCGTSRSAILVGVRSAAAATADRSAIRALPGKVRCAAVVGTGDGAVVCERCVIADTPLLRMRGLLGRDELAPGEGLWICPTASIHMFLMRFAIDAVFLDRDGVVVDVVANLKPWRTATRRHARSVLELAAGEAARRGIRVGDRLERELLPTSVQGLS